MKSKEALQKSSQHHKVMLEKELRSISDKTNSLVTTIMTISSGVAIIYVIYKLVNDSEKPQKKQSTNTFWPRIKDVLGKQVLLYVLKEGRKRIAEYINELERDDNS